MNRHQRRAAERVSKRLGALPPIDKDRWLRRVEAHAGTDETDLEVARELISRDTLCQAFDFEPETLERSTVKLIDLGFATVLGSGDTGLGEGYDLVFTLPEGLKAGRR